MRPDLPAADVASATADQLRAVWGPLTANAGTVLVKGNTVTTRATVAKNTFAMAGGFIESTFTLKGDILALTQVRNASGPIQNPSTITWRRTR